MVAMIVCETDFVSDETYRQLSDSANNMFNRFYQFRLMITAKYKCKLFISLADWCWRRRGGRYPPPAYNFWLPPPDRLPP